MVEHADVIVIGSGAAWILGGAPPMDLAPLAATRFETESWSEEQLRQRALWQYRHFYGSA